MVSPQKKVKKIIVKISRHPLIIAHTDTEYEDRLQIKKCRVNLERMKGIQPQAKRCTFSLIPKAKRCCVRVARLPDVERSEISVTPASSIVCSDFDDDVDVE